jgi:hypothetical protein
VKLLIEVFRWPSETIVMLPSSPQWRHVATALPHFLIFATALGMSSCVPIPVEVEDERLFEPDQVDFIEIGRSTKADISAAMSELPKEDDESEFSEGLAPIEYQDGEWWLYVQLWSSDRWLFMPVIPTAPYVSGQSEYRFLLINFDNDGIVSHYETSTLQNDGCNQSGICKKGSEFILLGRSEDVQSARLSESLAEKCGVYLYTDVDFTIPIVRNGSRVGRLVDDDHFLYWQLDPGRYELKSLSLDDFDRGPIEFECAIGELYFLEFQRRTRGAGRRIIWIEIVERDPVEGHQAIESRQLMLGVVEEDS